MFDGPRYLHQEANSVFNTQTKEIAIISVFVIVVLASATDLFTDLSHGATIQHVAKEAVIVGISVLAIAWLLLGLRQQALDIAILQKELKESKNSPYQPKKYILEKLDTVITQQFSEWKLTGSETEAGWLLLKGLQPEGD